MDRLDNPQYGAALLQGGQPNIPQPMPARPIKADISQLESGPVASVAPQPTPREPIQSSGPQDGMMPQRVYPDWIQQSKNPRVKQMYDAAWDATDAYDNFTREKREKRAGLRRYSKTSDALQRANDELADLQEVLTMNPKNYFDKYDAKDPRKSVPNESGRGIIRLAEKKMAAIKRLEQEEESMRKGLAAKGWLAQDKVGLSDDDLDQLEEQDNKSYDNQIGQMYSDALLYQPQ